MTTPTFLPNMNYYDKIFAYRIDDEIKLITHPGCDHKVIKQLHELIYPKERYETELIILDCPKDMFIYRQLLNQYKFFNNPDIDLDQLQVNLRKMAEAMSFFKLDPNNPVSNEPIDPRIIRFPAPDQQNFLHPDHNAGITFQGIPIPMPDNIQLPIEEDDLRDMDTESKNMMSKMASKMTAINQLATHDKQLTGDLLQQLDDVTYQDTKQLATNQFKKMTTNTADVSAYNNTGNLYQLSSDIFPSAIPAGGIINYDIYYNCHFNTAIIVEESSVLNDNVQQIFPELRIMYHVDLSKMKEIDELREKLPTQTFVNEYDCKDFLDKILYNKAFRVTTEDIKKEIKKLYEISDKIEHKMKFSDIYNKIKDTMRLNEENSNIMKKTLPNIFLEIGLQKKRYSDAIYYFGCVEKKPTIVELPKFERDYGYNIIDVNVIHATDNNNQVDPDEDIDDK